MFDDPTQTTTAEVQVVDKESQLGIALELKNNMLSDMEFVEHIPKHYGSGSVTGAKKQLRSSFSSSKAASISGQIDIDQLTGYVRFEVTSPSDLMYQLQNVSVSGQISVEQGTLIIYSPVDIDFWYMAAVFVDRPENQRPEGHDLKLKGYSVHRVSAGQPQAFNSRLVAIGSAYFLILATAETTVKGLHMTLE